MTNPNNAIGTNAAYGGRTSANAFNDGLAGFSRGILSGWACSPNTGMSVVIGGNGNDRDVAIAEDNAGNKTTINNISGSPVAITLSAAPASNSRIDAIVAYVDNPPQGASTEADNPGACGLIAVAGTPSSTPTIPNDSAIRTAITADGASGTTAYYVVLALITIPSGTTTITSTNISAGASASIGTSQILDGAVTNDKIASGVEQVEIKFILPESGTVTGTYQATLIRLPGNIGVLTYQGTTGWSDAGSGYRHQNCNISSAGFSSYLGYSINSNYSGNSIAYQTYARVTGNNQIDDWVYKETTDTQQREMSFVIIGTFNS